MLDEMMAACREAGIEAVGATLQHVADEILASPPKQQPFACEGAIFDLEAKRAEITHGSNHIKTSEGTRHDFKKALL
jgi:hypothetical protein